MKTLIVSMAVGIITIFLVSLMVVSGLYSTILQLRYEKDQLEDQFQTYRSAAQDAYSFAIGEDVAYGEEIPNEFFMRYVSGNISQEESLNMYKEAKKTVNERLDIRRTKMSMEEING